jgi:hypothetical protein
MEWGERKTVTFGFLLLCKPLRIELEIKEKKSWQKRKESFDELNESPSEKAQRNSSVQKNKFAVFPNEIRWKSTAGKKKYNDTLSGVN